MRDERLLKKDLFGEIRHRPGPDGGTIVRDTTGSALWVRPLARWLLGREARALAYSVWAHFLVSNFAGGDNLVMGFIGTQADKTVDALSAYLDLWDDMPNSADRFNTTKVSLDNQYRVSKIGFRSILNSVKAWERLGLKGDPREARYEAISSGSLDSLFEFYEREIKGKPKMISILGPSSAIDQAALKEFGELKELEVEEIFVD